jgi:hypothetical protein
MALQNDTSRIQYNGNNSTTSSYAIPFVFFENAHIKCVVTNSAGVDTTLALGSTFNVTGAANPNGGSLTTTAAVPTSSKVTIFREVPATQTTSYQEGGDFPAASHERALDKLTMIAQQTKRLADRALKVPETQNNPNDLPNPGTGNRLLGSNNGTLTWEENRQLPQYPATAGTNALVTSGGGSAPSWQTIPSIATGPITATGSTTPRFVADRFADMLNVKDFGAVGNGVTDDSDAIRAAVQYAVNNGKPLYFPRATYLFAKTTANQSNIASGSGLGISVTNSATDAPKFLFLIGDNAIIKNTVYCSTPTDTIGNYKWMSVDGLFNEVTIKGITFWDASPPHGTASGQLAIKRTAYCFQFNGLAGSPSVNHPKNITISDCTFQNYAQGINIYNATNVDVSHNNFFYEYGQASAGSHVDETVGVRTRQVFGIRCCNNYFDGCTAKTLVPVSGANDIRCPDGLILTVGNSGDNSNHPVVVSNNTLINFAFEGILLAGDLYASNAFVASQNECPATVCNNIIVGTPTIGQRNNVTNVGIAISQNNCVVANNGVYRCTTGILVQNSANFAGQKQGGHNTHIVGNQIQMAKNTDTTWPISRGIFAFGLTEILESLLIANNTIIGVSLPAGTQSGWNGSFTTHTSGIDLPAGIMIYNAKGKITNNSMRAYSHSAGSRSAAFQIYGGQVLDQLIVSDNTIDGFTFMVNGDSSSGGNSAVVFDGNRFVNGTRLIAGSVVQPWTTTVTNQRITFTPDTVGWYKLRVLGRFIGSGKLQIGMQPEMAYTYFQPTQDSTAQNTECYVAYHGDADGTGGNVDFKIACNQLMHIAQASPVITKMNLDVASNQADIRMYVSQIMSYGGQNLPVTIVWNNDLAYLGGGISVVGVESSTAPASGLEVTFANGSKNVVRRSANGQVSTYGSGVPTVGATAPSAVPEFIGQQYFNTATGIAYIAVGTTNTSDWKAIANWTP